jgi:hypothetical protein
MVVVATFSASILLTGPTLERDVNVRASPADSPQAIYSRDPKDPWNSIFHHLFSRRVRARLTDEFPESGPFLKVQIIGFPQRLPVSTRLFERVEIGDRAIEPFYPSFLSSSGLREVLNEPRFSLLRQSLIAALNEERVRPALDRALMQADVWAAHDLLLAGSQQNGVGRTNELQERAAQLVPLLALLVQKLALSPEEINNLPDNYALATKAHDLPDLFSPESGWLEVQWLPDRLHDRATGYRRVARVFLKPRVPLRDKQDFLDGLPHNHGNTADLEAVALVTQNLVIDTGGSITPTRITCEIQTRVFERGAEGRLMKTVLRQYELSRKLLLEEQRTGGLISLSEDAPTYLPTAGNDYGFATPQRDERGETLPILATLRTRCGTCHGQPNAPAVFTFLMHAREPTPPVKLLPQPNDIHARYIVGRKVALGDYQILAQHWHR